MEITNLPIETLKRLFICPSMRNGEELVEPEETLIYKSTTLLEKAKEFLEHRKIDDDTILEKYSSKMKCRSMWTDQQIYIGICDDIRKRELISEKFVHSSVFEFDGFNCDSDECNGWDGESRRCECGNRRVDWELRGHFCDDDAYVYAEAY